MMFTTPMTQIFAVVLSKDSRQAAEELLREGVMQFISVSEFETAGLKNTASVNPEVSFTEASDLRKRIEGFLHSAGIVPETPKETDLNNRVAVDIEKERQQLDKIDGEREIIRERQRSIQQEIMKIEDIRRQMQLYGLGFSGIRIPGKQSMLSVLTGKLPVSNLKQLEDGLRDMPALNIALGTENNIAHHLVVSMKRDSELIGKILANAGWTKVELPSEIISEKKNVIEELSSKLAGLTKEQQKLKKQVDDLVSKEEEHLREIWGDLRVNELCYKIQACFSASERTVVFAGWVPSAKKKNLIDRVTKVCEGRCYLESYEAGSKDAICDEIPVVLNNPKILAPFQMLVSNFGIPQYGTIDPTFIVTPLYLAMFGLMFADAAQGLILAILGILGAVSFGKNQQKKGFYQLSWLVIWCGLSSIIFGVLFGSYFGMSFFKPLWFDYHGIVSGHNSQNSVIKNIYDILSVTLYFGIFVIVLGLLFNWINLIRTGKWLELIFDKGGILGGWIYAGGIYIASYMISHEYREYPAGNVIFMLVALPGLLFLIKGPCRYFLHQRHDSENKSNLLFLVLNFLMEWVIELLEIFSGYLSNTLSFMRVAGLGIAHACLMISFFTLAEMTSGILSILI
ncbi:MAG: hypothetical protein E4H40_02700, partial [Candidatus Brocadiia bacterium]